MTPLPSDHKHGFLEWHHVATFVQGETAGIWRWMMENAGEDGAQVLWVAGSREGREGRAQIKQLCPAGFSA